MKTILAVCAALMVAILVWALVGLRGPKHFGEQFTGAPLAKVVDLLERPGEFLGKRVTLQGKVQDQCPTSGCFFYFSAGNKKLRIELGDVAQKIPKRPGAPVTVEGQLVPYGDTYQFLGIAAEFE